MAKRRRQSTRGIEWQRVWAWVVAQRDRVIIFSLLGIIVGYIGFMYFVTAQRTVDQRLKELLPSEKGREEISPGPLAQIKRGFRVQTLEEGYGDIITQNVFETAEQRRERIERIRSLYEQGRAAYESRQLERAQEAMEAVLDLDPFEKAIEYPERAGLILARIINDRNLQAVRERYERLVTVLDEAWAANNGGSMELARERFGEALRVWSEIESLDPGRVHLDKPVYEKLGDDMSKAAAQFDQIVRQQLIELRNTTVARVRELMAEVATNPDLSAKANAIAEAETQIAALFAALNKEDPESKYLPEADRQTAVEAQAQVKQALDDLRPVLQSNLEARVNALSSETTADEIEDVGRLLAAGEALGVSSDLLAQWRARHAEVAKRIERDKALAAVGELRTEAEALAKEVDAARQPGDFDRWDALLVRAKRLQQSVAAYTQNPDPDVRQAAADVVRLLEGLPQPPPALTGWRFIQLSTQGSRQVVTLCQEAKGERLQFFVGLPRSGIIVDQVADDGSWVRIKPQAGRSLRPTRLDLEKEYVCGG